MEEAHSLLGIHPAAGSDEIEAAYQRKKQEFDPNRFAEGSSEKSYAAAMQIKLEKAYNDAIMASFAPVRAFSIENASPGELRRAPKPAPQYRQVDAVDLDGLVEEAPVSFSDEDLLKMDVSRLRETCAPPTRAGSRLPSLGIEDPLVRSLVWMLIGFVLLDFMMRLIAGPFWTDAARAAYEYLTSSLFAGSARNIGVNIPAPPPSGALWSLVTSVVSMLYIFFCSLIMPIIVRFFLMGEPVVEARLIRWALNLSGVAAAWIIMIPLGLIFRLLPAEWAGSSLNLFFVTPLICNKILKYGG